MYKRVFLIVAGTALCASAQPPQERRANITGGGDRDRGKCTIEVVVDGSAEVEIQGERALLRNLAGQLPQWRRFVCNMPMPVDPPGFRFTGVDGRGRQTLVRAPERGGPAVIRIDDPPSGSEGYTFDITWQLGGTAPPPDRPFEGRGRGGDDRFYADRDDFYRGDWRGRLFSRVRQDLDHVSSFAFRGDDRYRLDSVYRELDDLQRDYASGRWDRRALADVIDSLDRVTADNRLAPRDRDLLRDDLGRLRELREGGRGGEDRFYADRDDFYRGDWHGRLFGRVREDLNHVAGYAFRGDDRYRLDNVYRELDDLQRDYASGRWDRRALADVIDSLDRVTADNRLAPRDRDLLRDDLGRLRELHDRR